MYANGYMVHVLRYSALSYLFMEEISNQVLAQRLNKKAYVVVLQCSYGNCQTTFHPSCARSAGFHMAGGGKLPHKGYCEKHSLEQKAKVLFCPLFSHMSYCGCIIRLLISV